MPFGSSIGYAKRLTSGWRCGGKCAVVIVLLDWWLLLSSLSCSWPRLGVVSIALIPGKTGVGWLAGLCNCRRPTLYQGLHRSRPSSVLHFLTCSLRPERICTEGGYILHPRISVQVFAMLSKYTAQPKINCPERITVTSFYPPTPPIAY